MERHFDLPDNVNGLTVLFRNERGCNTVSLATSGAMTKDDNRTVINVLYEVAADFLTMETCETDQSSAPSIGMYL